MKNYYIVWVVTPCSNRALLVVCFMIVFLLVDFLFNPEDVGDIFLPNVG
jgi:hypothetical protein